ncbi:efflux RND transporter permease subunit [candidate division KSB1 bacterium]|nr:efflux RND transporter permease subunit [candidate division KSB1 bacterium]RQW04371.1 MAG: efflux RND transporter permease subunit [candidate division KSB1 bacterium]
MRKIVSTFVKFPFYANIIIAVVVIGGLLSLANVKQSAFPEITSRFISISVFYPGASPVEMEEGVTSRIEEAIRSIVGIKEFTSTSSENSATVLIETTGRYDIDETLMEVKNAVDGISSFPSAAERPIVFKQRSMSRAMFISLSGSDDLFTLKKFAHQVEDDFLNSGIISQAQIFGAPSPEISVEIKESDLLRYNLTFDEIGNAILKNNRDISGGQIKSKNEEILIRLRSRSADPDVIGNIILRGNETGGFLRVRDVAVVKLKEPDNFYPSYRNGRKAVSFMISKLPEENLAQIDEFVKNYIKEFNATHEAVQMKMDFSFLEILKGRLDILVENGLYGFLLVVISLTMFLSFRVSFWVAWGIPFSFLAMFILVNLYGVTINMMSLFGMILVVGILVDDGIVIGENIYQHFEKGKNPMLAAVDGTMEVAPAVLTSVTTTIVAFLPLLFLQGTQMEVAFEMAFIVITALALSLLEAFFVLPAHLGKEHVLNRKKMEMPSRGLKKWIENFIIWLRDKVYVRTLDWILEWRYIMLGVPVALILISLGLFMGGFIKNTYFPMVDFDNFEINVAFVPGSGEEQTYRFLQEYEKVVWEVNEELMQELGEEGPIIEQTLLRVGGAFDGQEIGAHAGSIMVWPKDITNMDLTGHEIAQRVKEKIGPVPEAQKFTVTGRNRWGAPVSISLLSRNLEELEKAKVFLMDELANLPALKDIIENNAQGKQEILLKLKPKAYFLGLDENAIANQVRQGFYGGQIQRLQQGKDEIRIWVRYPSQDRENIGQMEKMKIKTPRGEFPLIELADYELRRGPVNINRFNGQREVRVEAETVDPYASVPEILAVVNQDIVPQLKAKYPTINVMYQGQQRESSIAMEKLQFFFIIAFAGIILLLMLHFKSTAQSIIILLMIPLSFLGAFWGHGIHGRPISIISMLGVVALSGVIVNDAVVFLSKYNSLVAEGMSVRQAIIEAGRTRLRPIILTTVTTSLGLFPLILEKSHQAQFLIPMAISLAYGVAIGTFFILIFFPVLIYVLNDLRVATKGVWTGIKPSAEEVEIGVIYSKRHID